eukprot:423414-Alexandrium_andersonii.AAC.1
MAAYLQETVLDCAGAGEGCLSAAWHSGTCSAPAGFSTYAECAVENRWKCLKGLLPRGFRH